MFSFIETKLFSRLAQDLLSDDKLAKLQFFLMENPEAGNVVPGSGGVRKLRWGMRGRGKRGWFAGNLLCENRAGSDLHADHLPEKRNGEHSCQCSPSNS